MNHTYSIKQKLVFHLLLLFFATWLVVTIASLYADYRNFEADFEQSIESQLQEFLIEWASYDAPSINSDDFIGDMSHWSEEFELIQIWDRGQLVFSSQEQAPRIPLNQTGFVSANNSSSYIYKSSSNLVIAARLHNDGSGHFFEAILFRQLLPFILLLPLMIWVLYKIIGNALAPLQSVTRQITEQTPGQLQGINLKLTPIETIPLIQGFNQLVQSLNLSFKKEQRFTANAAHELLTPLAAIKSEVQLFQQQFSKKTGPSESINEINARIDRATHTVKQLLLLSRYSEKPAAKKSEYRVNLHHLCQDLLSEMGNQLEQKQLTLDFQASEDIQLQHNKDALSVLCRNLMDNAIRYSPPQGNIQINMTGSEQNVILKISNPCHPLICLMKDQLTEPFVRGPGEKSSGSGIGLALVQQIVHSAQGTMTLDINEEHFTITITLPALITEAETEH